MPTGAARLGFWFVPPAQEDFYNEDFENGLTGWTTVNQRILWSGGTVLAGFPTPVLPDPNLYGCTGDASNVIFPPSYTSTLTGDVPPGGGFNSLELSTASGGSSATVNPAGASLFGPAVYTDYFVTFKPGNSVSFDWKAVPGEDAYTLFAYMVRDTGSILPLLRTASPDAISTSSWSTTTVPVSPAGNYKFVFVAGSWDSTFGTVVSGSMLIDNIKRIQ